jgi:hypothetical protein
VQCHNPHDRSLVVSVTIPTHYDVDLDLGGSVGSIGPVTVSGIPNNLSLAITNIPKILLGVDPLSATITVGLNPITLNPVTLNPVTLNLAVTEIPSVRAHFPMNYCIGLSILGIELFSVRLCGEGQAITEPYVPNPCERCGPERSTLSTTQTDIPRSL